jgi:uncharacterized protein (UPF0335 family)
VDGAKPVVDDWRQREGPALRKPGGLRNVSPWPSPLRQCEERTMSVTATTADVKDKRKDGASVRFAKDQLKAIVERIEHLEEEKKALAGDIRDVYAEAKGNGYDVPALRTVIRLRKQDKHERAEQEAILETYLHALGMI